MIPKIIENKSGFLENINDGLIPGIKRKPSRNTILGKKNVNQYLVFNFLSNNQDRWIKYAQSRDKNGEKVVPSSPNAYYWSLTGLMIRLYTPSITPFVNKKFRRLKEKIYREYGDKFMIYYSFLGGKDVIDRVNIRDFNDDPDTTIKEVLSILKKARL